MKRNFILLLTILATGTSQAQVTDVLFIGNSYVYTSDLPNTFYNLALSGGDSVYQQSNAIGGATLQNHTVNATSLALISSRNWDFVVMQEQSQLPSFSPAQVANDVYPFAAILVDSILSNDPCTEPVFFMTWGRKYGDASNCAVFPPVCTYNGMQARLRESYLEMGVDNLATVAPCGVAWKNAMTADSDSLINLYVADLSHPSAAGTYLNACVFYATIFRKSPVGYSFYGGLPQAQAAFLQQIAAITVLDSLDTWRIGANDAQADFTYANSGFNFQFTNNSVNATQHFWAFGDGTTSQSESPAHLYEPGGIVTVMHVASNDCDSDTVYANIDLSLVNSIQPEAQMGKAFVFVKGDQRVLSLHGFTGPIQLSITDLAGRVYWNQSLNGATNEEVVLPAGQGILSISSHSGRQWLRVF